MNYGQLYASYKKHFETQEWEDNFLYTLKAFKNWTTLDWLLVQNQEVADGDKDLCDHIVDLLSQQIPPQYILGWAEFYGLKLKVDERVLIPRIETEELVDLLLSENQVENLKVLDVGTGSGAIALAIKSNKSTWDLTALDISEDALALAKENAQVNQLDITFLQSDVYSEITDRYDIVVSNPPYIAFEDKHEVAENVLASEPHLALFAEKDGYAIYEKLIKGAKTVLKENGKLYLEIGYKQGSQIKSLFKQYFPNARVRVIKDQFNKDRMVVMTND